MGVITRGLITKSIVAPTQPIYFVGTTSGFNTPFATTVATTQTPTFTTPGDLLIYTTVCATFGGVSQYWTPPAGWTEVLDNGSPGPISSIGWKIATATDAGATWTSSAAADLRVALVNFRNATIDVVGSFGSSATNANTITIPGITTTVANTMLVAIIMSSNATGSLALPVGNWVTNTYITGSAGLAIFSTLQATAGATGNITANFTGATGGHWGALLSIKPK
jgi:hypothetical protein